RDTLAELSDSERPLTRVDATILLGGGSRRCVSKQPSPLFYASHQQEVTWCRPPISSSVSRGLSGWRFERPAPCTSRPAWKTRSGFPDFAGSCACRHRRPFPRYTSFPLGTAPRESASRTAHGGRTQRPRTCTPAGARETARQMRLVIRFETVGASSTPPL